VTRTGIVTILFTDLVESTQLLEELGDDVAEEVRRKHFQLLRDTVASSGGQEVKSLGDGLMVVFSSALDAAGCAVAMQQAIDLYNQDPDVHPLHVRVGLHAGEPVYAENDYFGMVVVVAKRLCDMAQGGQILASDLVRALIGSRGRFEFRELEALSLKGLSSPLVTCEVSWQPAGEAGAVPGAEARRDSCVRSARRPGRFGVLPRRVTPPLAVAAGLVPVAIVLVVLVIVPWIRGLARSTSLEGAIRFDEVRSGAIEEPGEVDVWRFTASGGGIVDIDLEVDQAGSLDPYVELMGPAGSLLAFSQYGGLWGVLLPDDAEYSVSVGSHRGEGTGTYQIELSSRSSTEVEIITATASGEAVIQAGQTVFGTIEEQHEVDVWKFSASAGDVANIDVEVSRADALDPYLELIGPAGTSLVSSEYGGLWEVSLADTGEYSVRVRSSRGERTGTYRIDLSFR